MRQVHLRLPATSANLGPGFDSLALALKLYLHIDAEPSEQFTIEASGRDAKICGASENNLLIGTYTEVLASQNRAWVPLKVGMHNEIPLGMGCGSSAAVRLAAVALASHFGDLAWSRDRILAEASRREGHPDNAAACWLGGFVASAVDGGLIHAISIAPPPNWRAVIVMPDQPLATTASRAVLPATWPRLDVVANLQRVALLTAAFATGKPDAVVIGMVFLSLYLQQINGYTPLRAGLAFLPMALATLGAALLAARFVARLGVPPPTACRALVGRHRPGLDGAVGARRQLLVGLVLA